MQIWILGVDHVTASLCLNLTQTRVCIFAKLFWVSSKGIATLSSSFAWPISIWKAEERHSCLQDIQSDRVEQSTIE